MNNNFSNSNQECTSIQKLFEGCESATLRHLMDHYPQWKNDEKIKQQVLDDLDNIFAFGYEEIRNYEHIQKILAHILTTYQLKQILDKIEINYVLSNLNRGACSWIAEIDAYDIDERVNANAVSVGRLFLATFIDIDDMKSKQKLQKEILLNMQDACLVGNWPFFELLRGFLPPMDIAERCYEECTVMISVVERENWIEKNWIVQEKKRKTDKKN